MQATGLNLQQELRALFEAGIPLINLVTYEEDRVDRAVLEAALPGHGVYAWDVREELIKLRPSNPGFGADAIEEKHLFSVISQRLPAHTILILRDFHMCWQGKGDYGERKVVRSMRYLAPKLREQGKFLVMTTPKEDVPVELKDDVFVMHVPLPAEEDLDQVLSEVCDATGARKPHDRIRHLMLYSALGLTSNQARVAFSRVFAQHREFKEAAVDMVIWEKRRVVRESGALEFTEATAGESDVGGLDLLKAYLKKRERVFTDEARKAELPYPKGVAFIGIPGTGKSLSAQMTASLLRLPLLRLDMGSIFGALVGESESHIRKAVHLAEMVSPCILWIDEMEKAFAGTTGPNSHGAATRVFATLLTWMQEHTAPVYVIATANDVSALPPELMGRFDRTFFLDAPNREERRQIFRIKMEKIARLNPLQMARFRLDDLVAATEGYVGREIERIVTEARYEAFSDPKHPNREITMEELMNAIKETVPITRSHGEVIDRLRLWITDGRAVPASSKDVEAPPGPRNLS